ncbi:hypothetical protein [Melghirimyces profundicolus]|uniref:hypothetical protein n=1 Tax=Melghirimyces profundicolus TaxID=1242148 RepID=UPI0011B290AE|nr:hypothetical protein [Melghirimyces profundicolus]
MRKMQPGAPSAVDCLNRTAGSRYPSLEPILDAAELQRTAVDFNQWLAEELNKKPVPSRTRALNFGLFEKETGVGLYMAESKEWDSEDDDWACPPYDEPARYAPRFKVYDQVQQWFQVNKDVGVLGSIGITTFLIISAFPRLHPRQLPDVWVTTGFDDGELYRMGRWTKDGWSE